MEKEEGYKLVPREMMQTRPMYGHQVPGHISLRVVGKPGHIFIMHPGISLWSVGRLGLI